MEATAGRGQILIWLDCDTGHDDAFAILLAAHHAQAKLLGISTVHGNASLDYTAPNTCAVLQACGRSDVPVIRGESRPLVREPCFAPEYHGESGLDGVSLLPIPDSKKLDDMPNGTKHIIEAIMKEPPGSVWIVATGPLTNIAKAIRECPALVSHIRGLSIMGGAIGNGFTDAPMHRTDGPGNWTSHAEFNIFCDPEAATMIFSNTILAQKTVLIPLDLTHQCRGTSAVQELLFGPGKTSHLRKMMQQVLTFFTETYRIHSGIVDGPPLHDPLAVYAVIRPDLFDDRGGERWTLDIRLESSHAGQTVANPSGTNHGIRIPRALDIVAFWQTIDAVMFRGEQCVWSANT